MATMPERVHHAVETVEHLIDQDVDHVYVWADDESLKRHFVRYPEGVTFLTGEKAIGDAGKFAAWDRSYRQGAGPAYLLTVDDDLYYPPDYVRTMVEAVDRYERRAVVSQHGRIYKAGRIPSYYRGGAVQAFRCLGSVDQDTPVNNVGTGVLALHSDALPMLALYEDFPAANMADVWFSILAKKRKLPLVVLAHKEGWIRHRPIDLNRTIWSQHRTRDHVQTNAVNTHQPFPIYT
jgi:hypothetical protein